MAKARKQTKVEEVDLTRLQGTEFRSVERIPIDLLRMHPDNARTHDSKQIDLIGKSLQAFGWMNPLLADQDGVLIAGHGRWMAAKRLGLTDVPVIRFEHLTDDELRAYRLTDNQLATLAGWDKKTLKEELKCLDAIDLDFNIETLGWDRIELDMILTPETEEQDPADEEVPEPLPPISQVGDLWLLGDHRVLCGSALEPSSFVALMAGATARASFVNPPYNVPIQGHVSGLGKVKHREFVQGSGELSEAEFRAFLSTATQMLASHLVDGAIVMVCMDWRGTLPLQLALGDAQLDQINLAVWTKTNAGMGSLLRSQHELIFLAKKGKAPHVNNVQLGKHGRYRTNVWRYPGVNTFGKNRMEELGAHPTAKPIALVADAIRDVSNRGDVIIDSFMGSGTTLLAAERTGRIAYGMDLDPGYIDVTIRRWEQMTGKVAQLAGTGQTLAELAVARASGAG